MPRHFPEEMAEAKTGNPHFNVQAMKTFLQPSGLYTNYQKYKNVYCVKQWSIWWSHRIFVRIYWVGSWEFPSANCLVEHSEPV